MPAFEAVAVLNKDAEPLTESGEVATVLPLSKQHGTATFLQGALAQMVLSRGYPF